MKVLVVTLERNPRTCWVVPASIIVDEVLLNVEVGRVGVHEDAGSAQTITTCGNRIAVVMDPVTRDLDMLHTRGAVGPDPRLRHVLYLEPFEANVGHAVIEEDAVSGYPSTVEDGSSTSLGPIGDPHSGTAGARDLEDVIGRPVFVPAVLDHDSVTGISTIRCRLNCF